MENISILDKKKCTGCRMCEQLCPVKAIDMIENEEGFIEPSVNEGKCIDCGLCYKRCPQLNSIDVGKKEKIEAYVAKNKNVIEQKSSSSGGIFPILANYFLENNGVVFGCTFNEKIEAEHICIKEKNELKKLKGSKYVQSNTKDTFLGVKENLKENKLVLYTGTPCQIAGLKAFLSKEYNNLFCVDLVCHGVPSPKLFKEYIKWIEEKSRSKVINYEFRNKEKNGWGLTSKITFENGKVKYVRYELDPYYTAFISSETYREACYNCNYANMERVSDITLADYWGVEKEHPEFYDENGVSAILVNTQKGKDLLKIVSNYMSLEKSDIYKVARQNKNLNASCNRTESRNCIYINLGNKEFDDYIKENLNFKIKIKYLIKNVIPKSLKKKLKRLIH